MRTKITLFLLLAAIGFAMPSAADAAKLILEPPSLSTDVSQMFTTRVLLDTEGDDVCSVLARITFDSARLDVVDVDTSGSVFPTGDASDGTISGNEITISRNDSQQYVLQCTTNETSGLVATIRFRAKALGAAAVNVRLGGSNTSGVYVRSDRAYVNVLSSVQNATYSVGDQSPPVVTITSPSEGGTLSGVSYIAVTATDNMAVTRGELYIDGRLRDTQTALPFSFRVDTTQMVNGLHTFRVVAYDAGGKYGDDTVNAYTTNVDNVAPQIEILQPADNSTVSGLINIRASSSDNQAVERVEFSFNGVLVGQDTSAPYSISYDTRTHVDGTYAIYATAFDLQGNVKRATSFVRVINSTDPNSDIVPPPSLYLVPDSGTYITGQDVVLKVLMNTDDRPVISAAARLTYDPSIFTVKSISGSSSAFSVEAESCPLDPCPSGPQDGVIHIARGTLPPGLIGTGIEFAEVTLHADAAGSSNIDFGLTAAGSGPSRIITNDAQGTDILANIQGSSLVITQARGDLDNSGAVDIIDLGILLSNWAVTTFPPADLNQDGRVDIIDLGILLSNWTYTP